MLIDMNNKGLSYIRISKMLNVTISRINHILYHMKDNNEGSIAVKELKQMIRELYLDHEFIISKNKLLALSYTGKESLWHLKLKGFTFWEIQRIEEDEDILSTYYYV